MRHLLFMLMATAVVSGSTALAGAPTADWDVTLSQGWNNIAVPLRMDGSTVEDFVDEARNQGIDLVFVAVWDFDQWTVHPAGLPFNRDIAVEPGRGYMVYALSGGQVQLQGRPVHQVPLPPTPTPIGTLPATVTPTPSPGSPTSAPTQTPTPTPGTPTPGVTETPTPSPTVTVSPVPFTIDPECHPFSTSNECILPYPSSFFQVADSNTTTGVRNAYPQSALNLPPGSPPLSIDPTNAVDGASPMGPILLHFGVDVNASYLISQREVEDSLLPDSPIALFDAVTGERLLAMAEMDQRRDPNFPDRYALIVRPLEPMETGHRHIIALTRDLRDDQGNPLPSAEAFEYLRDGVITTSPELEAMRPDYEQMFSFLDRQGYQRDNLLIAWDFMVASEENLTRSILSMREQALTDFRANGTSYILDEIRVDPNSDASRIIHGRFKVPTFLNAINEIEYDAQGGAVRQADRNYNFAVVIPKVAETIQRPMPLIMFGHGLFGSGQGYFSGGFGATFSELANDAQVVMVATDWIGLSSGDLGIILSDVLPNLDRITLITDRLQQSLINNVILTELAVESFSTDPDFTVGTTALIDHNIVHYYGVSLGGIQGASLMSISPRIQHGVLAVPGCSWMNMLSRSVHWNLVDPTLKSFYPDPLLQQIGIALIQTRFDLSDPVNLTRLFSKNPLPDVYPDRRVLLQESVGDSQVPNITTRVLARAMEVGIISPEYEEVPGIPQLASPYNGSAMVQYAFPNLIAANPPPESNVPPMSDNGTHDAIHNEPQVIQQVFEFIETGVVTQYCNGACDPD